MIKNFFLIVCVAVASVSFYNWSKAHDEAIAKSAEQYETCTQIVYNMNPAQYREQVGEYPACNPLHIPCEATETAIECQERMGDRAEVIERVETGEVWAEVY